MELSFCQKIDEETGFVMPWFTHGALNEIKKWDLSGKVVLMFGAGLGDAWMAQRCKKLYVVERKDEWLIKAAEICQRSGVYNIEYLYRPCNDCSGMEEMYCELPKEEKIDIIISDDAYRTEVVRAAIDYFKENGGGILICDNYWQDYVWKSPIALEWLEPFEKHIHSQPDHTDYEEQGCECKTAIIFIK